jgi:hypothetical protein
MFCAHLDIASRQWTKLRAFGLVLYVLLVAWGVVAVPEAANATSSAAITQELATTSAGLDIFTASGGASYRYGPSIIINSDGSDDMWTCSPGSGGPADFIRYRHSTDNGNTWTADQVVLQPTSGGADSFSTCDPGVIVFGGYYYIAYTSTNNTDGRNNQVFVARGTSPTGPFDKWNGTGWGGSPQPFITYTDDPSLYGVGEPSMVVVGTTLYIYYSYIGAVNQTRVATGSTSNSNWPAAVTSAVVVYNRGGPAGNVNTLAEDSLDVKWVPSIGKFLGVCVYQRLTSTSYIKLYESTDGIHFTPDYFVDNDRHPYAHNIGMTGDSSGNMNPTAANFVSYAYGPNWGDWNLRLSPVSYQAVTSGAVADSFSGGLGSWSINAGSWTGTSAGLTQSDITKDPAYITRQSTAFGNATYEFDTHIISSASSTYGVALNFDKINATDYYYNSGYMVTLRANGNVFLYKAGTGVVAGDVVTGTNPTTNVVHVKIVQSGATISVYVGGVATPQISWLDTGSAYPSGWDSFITLQATGTFAKISFTNNVSDAFTTSTCPCLGTWSAISAGGASLGYTQSDITKDPAYITPQHTASGNATYQFDTNIASSASSTYGMGFNFDKTNATDLYYNSGYMVTLRANGNVFLYKAGTGVVVSDVATGTTPTTSYVHMKIVQTGSTIAVYVGGATTPQISWTDTGTVYPNGWDSLMTLQATATFLNLSFSSNVSNAYTVCPDEWVGNAGTWGLTSTGWTQSSTASGLSWSTMGNRVYGVASYDSSVQILSYLDPTDWVGLSIDKTNPGDAYTNSGYLIFLRANGNVSIVKAGVGPVVGDTATGTNPTAGPVSLRVVQSEISPSQTTLAVYVGGVTTPQITWTDSASAQNISGYVSIDSLSTTVTAGSFSVNTQEP